MRSLSEPNEREVQRNPDGDEHHLADLKSAGVGLETVGALSSVRRGRIGPEPTAHRPSRSLRIGESRTSLRRTHAESVGRNERKRMSYRATDPIVPVPATPARGSCDGSAGIGREGDAGERCAVDIRRTPP